MKGNMAGKKRNSRKRLRPKAGRNKLHNTRTQEPKGGEKVSLGKGTQTRYVGVRGHDQGERENQTPRISLKTTKTSRMGKSLDVLTGGSMK